MTAVEALRRYGRHASACTLGDCYCGLADAIQAAEREAAAVERVDAGSFRLDEDELTGHRFWRGGGPGDKDESRFDLGEPLILDPEHWAVGTIVSAQEPLAATRRPA